MDASKKLTTNEAAAALGAAKQTPRTALCRHGHWLGMIPVKLPNGRLLWDSEQVQKLANGGGK